VEELIENAARGNVAEVKTVLASVALALGVYQLVMIAAGYGKLRLPFLDGGPATRAHRAVGDALAVILLLVGVACLSYYGFEDDKQLHMVAGSLLLAVLAVKITVVRKGGKLGRALPALGLTVFALLVVTWASSAGGLIADG
jgi:hypothetical protein